MICYTICRISEFEITIVEKEGKIIQASFGSCGICLQTHCGGHEIGEKDESNAKNKINFMQNLLFTTGEKRRKLKSKFTARKTAKRRVSARSLLQRARAAENGQRAAAPNMVLESRPERRFRQAATGLPVTAIEYRFPWRSVGAART